MKMMGLGAREVGAWVAFVVLLLGAMKGLGAREAAEILGVSIRSIRDVRWRSRVRLAARRIGRRLIFTEQDLQALLRRNVERFPDAHGGRPDGRGEGEGSRDGERGPGQGGEAGNDRAREDGQ